MKKGILSILAILYIVSITGATLHTHFCMGRFAGWGLVSAQDEACGKCGMEKHAGEDNGCCTDEQELVKVASDHQGMTFDNIKERNGVEMDIAISPFQLRNICVPVIAHEQTRDHAPPAAFPTPLFILHRTFLI
ncbi:MAG TPA: hypothetical protein VK907_07820 [Phnomibacter sp.]|nr:hypothetical protein [Phnomibacter sp.]